MPYRATNLTQLQVRIFLKNHSLVYKATKIIPWFIKHPIFIWGKNIKNKILVIKSYDSGFDLINGLING